MKHTTIFKDPEKYCSFPSIVRLKSGHLLLAFRMAGERSVRAAQVGAVTHHDPESSIGLIESLDNGQNWPNENVRIISETEANQGVNDPGLSVLENGDLLLRNAVLDIVPTMERKKIKGKLVSHRPEHNLVATLLGNQILISSDEGKIWNELAAHDTEGLKNTCSREPVLELDDNSLLLSVYYGAPQSCDQVSLLRSYDGGVSWGDLSIIASDPNGQLGQHSGTNYNETAILHLGNGEILAMIRADRSFISEDGKPIPVGGIGELMVSRSFDAGLSWVPPSPSGIWGQPAHLLRMNDGRILCTYGYRKQPYGIRAVISEDRGYTWSDSIVLRANAPSWDIGYPCSLHLQDDSILTAYYFHEEDGIRYIASTIWRPL